MIMMTTRTKTILGIIAFAAFLGLAFWGYTVLSAAFLAPQQSANETPSTAKTLQTAPDFTVFDESQKAVKLSDFSGQPVVLNFWASWCPPCKSEMPHFNQAYQEYHDDVVFLMVDQVDGSRETREKGLQYVRDQGYSFPVYFDTNQDAATAYGVTSIPTTLFINADGKIVSGYRGAIDEATLRSGIALIKQ
jgi:thiol-disulfide isomerase/thioredoxin